MTHKITFAPLNGPLPIPHFLGWPDYTPKGTYDVIIPEKMELKEGDTIVGIGNKRIITNIIERRPAKGDWSKQKVHTQPHYVKFTAK